MKTVLLVPGFTEKLDSRDYASVLKAIEEEGYEAEFYQVKWRREATIHDWVDELCVYLESYDMSETIVAAFSVGAVIALCAAAKKRPSQLWLVSLPPHFAEDEPGQTVLRLVGPTQHAALRELKFPGADVACPTLLFIGADEGWKSQRRTTWANEIIPNSEVIQVPGVNHDITHPNCIEAIRRRI